MLFSQKIVVTGLALALLSGCASTTARQAAGVLAPSVAPQLTNAQMELGQPVSATAQIHVYQIFGINVKSGDAGKHGGFSTQLANPFAYDDLSLFGLLFGSPATKSDAVSAAKYNAIASGVDTPIDALIETRVKAHSSGFSLMGVFGFGTSTAQVDGYGVSLKKK